MNPVFRSVLIQCTLMSFLGAVAAAADSWSKKPYSQWTEDECLKILADSPWSKSAFGIIQTATGSVDGSRLTQGSGAPGAPCNTCDQKNQTAAQDSAAAGGNDSPRPQLSMAPCCQVVWFSSQHIRQAIYRLRILHGETPDARVEDSLQVPVAEILIAVSSRSLDRFQSATSASLKNSTFLALPEEKDEADGNS